MRIDENPQEFLEVLKRKELIVFDNQGQWSKPDFIQKHILRYQIASKKNIAERVIAAMDRFEIEGTWRGTPSEPLVQKMQHYIHCAKQTGKLLKDHNLKAELKLRIHALRMKVPNHAETGKTSDSHYRELKIYAKKWAESRWNVSEKELSKSQKKQLKELKKYPKLVKQLVTSETLFKRFTSWSLTYQCGKKNSVEIFRKYPGITQFLIKAELHKPIGYHGGLKLEQDTLTLPAQLENEGTLVKGKIDLLNPNASYIFKNEYACTTAQILDNFRKYNHRWDIRDTHLVYEGNGIENFNPYQRGSWDPKINTWKKIDLRQEDFYKYFPKIKKKYKKKELESTYEVCLKKGDWLYVLEAGRDNSHMDPSNAHAWVKIYKPTGKDQYKLVVAVSQSAKENYKTATKKFGLFMNTVPAGICTHEPRIYDREQQFRGVGFSIPDKGKKELLKKLQEFLQKEEKGALYYQVVGNNCFQSVIDFSKTVVGAETFAQKCSDDDLKVHVLDFDAPLNIFRKLNQFIKKKGGTLEKICLSVFGTLWGQHRSMRCGEQEISVATHSSFAMERKIYAPQKFIGLKPTRFI